MQPRPMAETVGPAVPSWRRGISIVVTGPCIPSNLDTMSGRLFAFLIIMTDAHGASRIVPPGTAAPEFELHSTPDQTVRLSDFRGRPVVLVFYPADWSPVCGDQIGIYNEMHREFQE